jgi:hypothetical protein
MDARRTLIMVSGTHGVEGYAGSDAQSTWLDDLDPARLPPDTNIVFLHLLNAWGTAWRRRHDEANVDLNRHFIDRTVEAPVNEAHAGLVRRGFLDALEGATPAAALASLSAFRMAEGEAAYAKAVFQGQYDCPGGLGFGGTAPGWSQRSLVAALLALTAGPEVAALIDLHTGLGPFGIGTLICTEAPGSAETAVLRQWYDEPFVALLEDQQGLPYQLQGDLANGVRAALPDTRVLPISLEFGTYEADRFAALMVMDAWAERTRDPMAPEVEAIRCDLLHFFYPRSALWRHMVAARASSVAAMALKGMTLL